MTAGTDYILDVGLGPWEPIRCSDAALDDEWLSAHYERVISYRQPLGVQRVVSVRHRQVLRFGCRLGHATDHGRSDGNSCYERCGRRSEAERVLDIPPGHFLADFTDSAYRGG